MVNNKNSIQHFTKRPFDMFKTKRFKYEGKNIDKKKRKKAKSIKLIFFKKKNTDIDNHIIKKFYLCKRKFV